MTDLTATAKKIMEVFGYFKIKADDTLSLRLFLTRKYLWRNIEDEEVHGALKELAERGYIQMMDDEPQWKLLNAGAEYLKQQKR